MPGQKTVLCTSTSTKQRTSYKYLCTMYLSTLSLSEKAKYKSEVHSICTCTYCTGTSPMSATKCRVKAKRNNLWSFTRAENLRENVTD